MKKALGVFITFALLLVFNVKAEEIASLESYEKKLEDCLGSFSEKNRCLATMIKNHLPKGNESVKNLADKAEDVFIQWLASESVENVYPIERKTAGDFKLYQNYIIEDNSAATILFEITYRRVLGKWYVISFNVSSKKEAVAKAVGI